jgi:hypothetical protein
MLLIKDYVPNRIKIFNPVLEEISQVDIICNMETSIKYASEKVVPTGDYTKIEISAIPNITICSLPTPIFIKKLDIYDNNVWTFKS